MPVYSLNGKIYDIPDDLAEGYEEKYPDASVDYDANGKVYSIPLDQREGFLKKYPDAVLSKPKDGSIDNTEQPVETAPQPDASQLQQAGQQVLDKVQQPDTSWRDEEIETGLNQKGEIQKAKKGDIYDNLYQVFGNAVSTGKPGDQSAYAQTRSAAEQMGIGDMNTLMRLVGRVNKTYAKEQASKAVEDIVAKLPERSSDPIADLQSVYYDRDIQKRLHDVANAMGNDYEDIVNKFVKPQLAQAMKMKYGGDDNEWTGVRGLHSNWQDVNDRWEREHVGGMLGDIYDTTIKDALDAGEARKQQVLSEKMPGFDIGSIINAAGSKAGAFMEAGRKAVQLTNAYRQANKAADPDNILQSLIDNMSGAATTILQDEKTFEDIWQRASAKGMDVNEYIDKYVAPQMQQALVDRFEQEAIRREMPKDTKDYILNGLKEDNVAAMLFNSITRTAAQNRYASMADMMTEEGKNPNVDPGLLAEGARLATGMAADFWLWGGWGKIGGKATEALLSRRLTEIAARRGLTEAAAREVLMQEAKHNLKDRALQQVMQHIPQSVIMGTGASTTTGVARDIKNNEDVGTIISNAIRELPGHALTFTAFGGANALTNSISANWKGWKKLLGKALGYEGSALTLYGTGEMSKKMNGQDAFEQIPRGLLKAHIDQLAMHFASNPGRAVADLYKAVRHPVKWAGTSDAEKMKGVLTEEDVADLMESADGKALWEVLSDMKPDVSTEALKDGTAPGAYGTEETAARLADWLNNKDRPADRKRRVGSLLGFVVPKTLETTSDNLKLADDGSVMLRTRDKDGNCVQELHFDTVDEADKWQQDHQRQLEMNDMLELWNGTDADRRMAAVLKMMEATGLQKPGDIQAIFEGRGDAGQTAALYDALKQVAVRVDEPNAPRFYEEGRQLSPEEQHDASVKEQRIFRLIEGQGEDFAADVLAGRDNPDVSLPQIREKYGDVKARMATIYYNNYARTKGVMDEIGTAVDSAIKAANERVFLNSHPSGNVVTVDIQGTKAYLTDGDVTVNADGTINANGHDTVIVRDAETGAVKMVPPGDIEVTGIYKDSDLVRQNEEMIRQQIEQTALDNVKYAPGTPDQAILGDIYTGADGMRYMVLADENGRMVKVALDENGDPIEGQMQPFNLEEYRTAKSAEIDAKEYGDDQIDIPDLEPAETSGGDRIPLEDNEEAETTQKQPVYQIPTNEKGQPDFENALPEQTRQFFVDKYGEEKASSMFARLAENSARAYDKLAEKGYPDTTDPNELMAYEDELDAAKAKADYWNGLATKKEEPVQQPVTEEKVEQPKVEEAPKIEKGQINGTENGQKYVENGPQNMYNEAQPSETEQEIKGQTNGQKGGKKQQAKPAEPVTPPVQEPTAEQKIAQGTVKKNIGRRFGFQNQDGTRSEVVINSFKGDDKVEVTRQDYDQNGQPKGEPYKQDLNLVDVGNTIVNGLIKPVLSTEEKLREAYKGMKGIQNLIDVMSDDEMQKMLDAYQKGDKEALEAMKADLYETHKEDMILKNRDNRNDKVSRIMNGTAGREEKLRRVRKEYQGFEDAVVALSDEAMQPTTLEEYVADLHSRQPKSGEGPIAYFSYDEGGKKVVGLQDETGHGTKSGGDTKGYAPWLAPKGKGMSLKQYAENIHSQLPEAIQEQYSDQDVRNAILEVFGGAERPSDITTMVIRRGIMQAEQAARRMEDMWIEGGPDLHRVSPDDNTFAGRLARAKEQTNTEPSEAQKEKGNYKKGHISFGGYDFVMENPEGSFRRGTDKSGKSWEQKMNNTYGYILGKKGKDGDHLDMFINDAQDLDNWDGKIYVVDQVDPETGKFDEHKIMYGFDSEAEARDAYLSNYEEGWQGLGKITGVDKETFDKWLDSSDRKIKEFAEHSIPKEALGKAEVREATKAEIDKALMTELGNELKKSGVSYTDNVDEGQQIIDNYNSRIDQGSDSELIRPQKVTDQQTLDELEKGPTVKRYRAMQLIDGKLYPPMSAKVDGEMREPTEIGVWEQAEERPDLIKNGKFVLNKGQKGQGNVPAAYNPYFHTSTSGLNDQFTSAYKRPELVVVEVEIPESELTSGYKAEGAKDAVGNVDWHSGVVNGQLPADRQRQVTLSRYSKVNRIVPDSEVADMIAKQLEGTNIEVPYNVVTPALRAELEKRGVKIGEKPAGSVTEDINGNRLRQQKVEESFPVIGGDVTKEEIAKAMDSHLVKSWLSSGKDVDQNDLSVFNLFGVGTDLIREMARARLGINNKYHVSDGVFNNAVESLESLMNFAKEKGLDPAIADKYNLKDGETVKKMLDSEEPLYSDEEIEAILKVAPGAKEELKGIMQAFADENRIREEMNNLRTYDNGNAITKAFAMYDIAVNRLRDQYGTISKDTRNELLKRIATTPINGKLEDVSLSLPAIPEGQPMFFKTPDGHAYGFTYKGKIYVDPRIATAETPIHEYGHLWAEMKRQTDKEEWDHIKDVLLHDKLIEPFIEKVRREYPELTGDGKEDDFVEEVLTQFSGKHGAEKLNKMAEEIKAELGNDATAETIAQAAIRKVKGILNEFWKSVADMMGWKYTNAEDIADAVLRDMLNGVNPVEKMKEAPRDLKSQQEIERSLMGVHNITEEKLRKALKQGGLANPSMAVIDTKQHMHTDYGEISLIPKSSLIDSRTGRNAGTFTADAWTPSYPHVQKRMTSKGQTKFWKDIRKLNEEAGEMANQTRMAFDTWLDKEAGQERLAYWYLKEKGMNPELVLNENPYGKDVIDRLNELTDNGDKDVSSLPEDQIREIADMYHAYKERIGDPVTPAEERIEKLKARIDPNKQTPFTKLQQFRLEELQKYGELLHSLNEFVYGAGRASFNEGKPNVDATMRKARETMQQQNLQDDFNKWLDQKAEEYGVEEWLYNGTDNQGRQKWVRNTLENASRLMKKEGLNGAIGWSNLGSWIATVANKEKTLQGIRRNKKNLNTTREEHDTWKEQWGERLYPLVEKLGNGDVFHGDNILKDILEHNDFAGYYKREYGKELTREEKDLIDTFIKEVRTNFPTGYFETKFERPVGLEEFEVAVVPETTSPDIVEALKNAGLDVRTYDDSDYEKKNENRRKAAMEAVQGRDDIMFQLMGKEGADEADKADMTTERTDNLRIAEESEKAGVDAKAIKLATGWERGSDGKWRYEIPDADVDILEKYRKKSEEMKKRGASKPMPIFRLEDLLGKDNEVFKYYPQMRKMQVLFSNILPDGTAGLFDGKNIEINSKETNRFEGDDLNNENVYGTLLHEVQHAIQDIEGFARGGNLMTSTTEEGIKAIIEKKEKQMLNLRKEWWANNKILDNPEELKAAAELDGKSVKEVKDELLEKVNMQAAEIDTIYLQIARLKHTKAPARSDAIDLYNRLAGEVEARNVTNRMALNDIGKRQTLASVTEDVPREDQVIIMEDGTAMNINDIKPIGTNRFGGIYDQFKGKVKEAFDFLTKKKEGYLKGVFHRDDLGDIDLAWGSAPTDYTGKGLAHIIRKHIKVLKDFKDIDEAMRIIDDVVTNGTSKPNNDPRLVDIEKDNYRVVVAKNDEGNWILSAFDFVTPKKEKGKTLPPSKTPGQSDVEAGAVTSNLSLSGGKDMKNSDTIQEKSGKSSDKAPKFQKVGDDTHSDNFKNFFGDWEKEPEKASKIVDKDGKPMVVYHQTDNDFTVFDPRHKGAGTSDFETPFGIFMKPTSRDIGVRGDKQMPLYANIRNPFEVDNRRELSEALKKNVPGYKELLDEYNRIDKEYSERFKEAEKYDHDKNVENWNKWQRGEITEEEYQNSYSLTEEKVVDEWREAIKKPMSDMKELLDKWFRDSEYDGVIIRNDEGSFGRKTETIIALDANQVKSATDNIGTYDKNNPDIRFHRVSNPDPELTEEERQYWKKWDADMKKWKERNAIPAGMDKAPDKPAWVQGEPVMDFAKRMADWNKQRSLWQTAPKLEDYRQMRSDRDTLEAAKEELKKYPDSPMAKMRMAAAEFQQIRSAMGRQKAYDKATVKAVTDFAQEYMKMGFGDNLSRGEMERMLSSVKNATGAKDIRKEVDNIMNILTDNYLRNLDQQVQKLSSVKELKQTAQGVEAQGKLELKGQRMIQAFREARQTRMTADEIRERMAEVSEKMTRNDEEAPMWEQEYEGLSIALQYMDNIEASRSEWGALDREYKDAVKNYKESGLSYKEQQEYLEELDKAMMENKLERIGMFGEIIGRLQGNIAESMQGAKDFTEREKQRIANIQKMANTDLAGKDMGAMRVRSGKPANFFLQPLGTFEQMLKLFGGRNVKGEGNLYNYFMRNWMESTDKAYLGERKAKEELDEKAREVFGDNIKRWSDLYELTGNEKEFPGMDVEVIDQNEPKTFHLTQGNLLYIYMANKMNDGAMKLRKMGITEEDVNAIKEHLDPRLVQLGDWLQDEYLPSKRTEYNKVHERMFGAPMAAIDHYFPIRILGDARVKEEDVNVPDSETLPSTITGNIIKRRRNALPLDILHTDALSLAIEHIEDMERWAATAEWNKDINTLLSYTTFRNKVKNMDTIYGSGDALWNAFKDAAKMAAGTYESKAKAGGVDKAISNIAKGVTAAKINFRPYTALKQLLSTPAFLTQGASYDNLARYFLNPKNYWRDNFKWAIENMPVFKKRWESRQAGDTRLMENDTDWNVWRKKWTKELTRRGMWLNAGADALTIAAGARAIYETKHRKYVEMGASEEEAHKRAIQDAEIGYNLTQQSSEGAFVSKIQMDRTVAANMLSVFRNSSMSYTRQWVDAARNLNRMSQKGYKDDSIAFMTRQFQDQLGLSEEQAREAAEAEYKRAGRNEVAKLLNMMFGVTVAWNLGASLPYLLLGDDDKTKKEMMTDALMKGLLAGPTEGLAGGNVISDFVGLATNEGVRRSFKDEGALGGFGTALDNMGEHDINPLPLFADIERMISKLGYDGYAAAQDLFNICAQSAVGVNPQTFTDMWEACMDYGNPSWMPLTDDSVGNKDLSNANEIALFIMRVMNAPASSWKNKYIDELGMNAEDAKKLPYEEMARRYANYKHWKDAPLMGWLRGEEARNAKIDKLQKQFDKAVQERMDRLTDREIQDNLVRSESIEERRKYAKMIAQRLGLKPDANSEQAKDSDRYQTDYQRHMLYDDIAEDLLLAEKKADLYKSYMEGKEEATRKSAIDENEYVKANKDRKKRLDEAKTEIEKRLDWIRDGKYDSKNGRKGKHKDPSKAPKLLVPGKRQLETTEDEKGIEDIMENIRKWRKEALQLAEQAGADSQK